MNALPAVSASVDEQVRTLQSGCGAMVLEDLAVLEARGGDRASWLNGLVTQDTRAIPSGRAVYAAAVAVKGKILTDLWVCARPDALLLLVPRARAADLFAHLDRYIVMEDVTLATLDVQVLSLQGPGAVTPPVGEVFAVDRGGFGGFDVVLSADTLDAVAAWVRAEVEAGQVTVVGAEAWSQAAVLRAVPRFGADFDTSNFVQEAAITPRAVSFNKGCYLGQEVVCRLEMRGQVQRHLLALEVSGAVPSRGDVVKAEGQDVGVVTSVAPVADGARVLAMVRHAASEKPLELLGRPAVTRAVFGA
jgi:folate-binding protein YgfZ